MNTRPAKQNRIAIAQVGGPTAVINCSLYGFLREIQANKESSIVFGILEGMDGLVEGNFLPLDMNKPLEWLTKQPGAIMGSGRRVLTSEDLEMSVAQLKLKDIHSLVLIGGNGTMWAAWKLSNKAKEMGYELQVIGIPKTVDNDIMITDHTPGFPSAAKFVAHAVRDLAVDLASMKNFEQVRVVETMGRNVGWLTAASAYFKQGAEDAPHLIYLPEAPLDLTEMVAQVKDIHSQVGYCLLVVSEGMKGKDGLSISVNGINNSQDNGQGMKVLGGVGSYFAQIISNELGLACRYENLGIHQRCASLAVSIQDQIEAEAVGRKAARLLFSGCNEVMVTLNRINSDIYQWETGDVILEKVAGIERTLDNAYLQDSGGISVAFQDWLRPLIGSTTPYQRFL